MQISGVAVLTRSKEGGGGRFQACSLLGLGGLGGLAFGLMSIFISPFATYLFTFLEPIPIEDTFLFCGYLLHYHTSLSLNGFVLG